MEGSFSTIRRLASLGENKVRSGRHLKRAPARTSHRSGCAWRGRQAGHQSEMQRPASAGLRSRAPSVPHRPHRIRPPRAAAAVELRSSPSAAVGGSRGAGSQLAPPHRYAAYTIAASRYQTGPAAHPVEASHVLTAAEARPNPSHRASGRPTGGYRASNGSRRANYD